jgi:hypothetical protein
MTIFHSKTVAHSGKALPSSPHFPGLGRARRILTSRDSALRTFYTHVLRIFQKKTTKKYCGWWNNPNHQLMVYLRSLSHDSFVAFHMNPIPAALATGLLRARSLPIVRVILRTSVQGMVIAEVSYLMGLQK